MSYESEERYWTDYLRVALPVIGLLLMLALFWWWAQQFIGDDGDPTDVANSTATAQATIAPPPTATVEITVEATQEGGEEPTENPDNPEETPDGEEPPTDCDSEFVKNDIVVVTEDGVRLRDEPDTTQDNIAETLEAGTELIIVADCFVEDDEGTAFWRVRNELTAATGYVAAEYLEAAPEDEE